MPDLVSRVLLARTAEASSLRVGSGWCRVVPGGAGRGIRTPHFSMDRPAAPPIWICASKWTDVPPVLGPSFSCQCICQCVSAAQVAGPAPVPASSFSYYSNFHIHLVRRHPRSIATTRINGAQTDPENSDKFSLPLTCSFFLRPAHKRRPLLVPSFVVSSASRRHTQPTPFNSSTWPVGRHRSAYVFPRLGVQSRAEGARC